MELAEGTPIGPYRVEALIARGGMGAVYRARRADGAVVALKLLQADVSRPDRRARFEREAELTARLAHPNVVRVHGAGAVGALHYLVMDLVDGEPLSARCGRLSPQEAMRAVAEVARGIEHAHERGVLHRDIKPGNVLVRRDDGRALITDFGIARAMDSGSSLTRTGAMVGTPFYMAPEQVVGQPVTVATDVHGLGLLLYEALTGVSPFQREELAAVLFAVTDIVPRPPSALRPGVPRAVDLLCAAALAKDPARRPAAGVFAVGLEAALAAPDAPRRGSPRLALGLTVVAACAGGLLVVSQARSTLPDDGPAVSTAVVATRTSTRRQRPKQEQQVTPEPRWLRALQDDGSLETLRSAEQDTRGALAASLPPSTRDAVLKAAERLARRWRNPTPDQVTFVDEGQRAQARRDAERLILIHALRRRLDPRGAVPEEVLSQLRMLGIVAGLPDDSNNFAYALIEVMPDDLLSYTLYASTLWLDSDERVLRRGLTLADAAQDGGAWRNLASTLADRLAGFAHDPDPARARAARVALDELVEEGVARAHLDTGIGSTLLEVAAQVATRDGRHDDALQLLGQALPFFRSAWDGHSLRADAAAGAFGLTRDPAHAAIAIEDLEALLRFAEADRAACKSVVIVIEKLVHLLVGLGRHEEALTALDRLIAVTDPGPCSSAALVRVVLEARHGRAERVAPALEQLARCLDGRRERIQALLTPADQRVFDDLQRTIRQALAPGAGADLPALASGLEAHPARRYLRFDFAGY